MATIESNFESICINPNDDLVLYKKEIIRSRIEKFLYAICSLDTDDLPTPLSRIEELYNCLVTGGDIPTFTPLSRAEKFVMAMLGAYDVELLPTPISRSETLMKKIATGDNNLDDIDNLQSRYEFLLAYIIKAGGFNGGSGDFYYNLTSLTSSFTTIYGTLDKPVKNAVLKGQTLVNLVKKLTPENLGSNKEWGLQGSSKPTDTWNSNGSITITSTATGSMVLNYYNLTLFKPNTEYTLFVSVGWNDVGVTPHLSKISTNDIPLNNGLNIVKFTTVSDLTVKNLPLRLGFAGTVGVGCEYTFNNIIVLEGDWTNDDIPYFEGMASVKMPVLTTAGKNLFDINKFKGIGIDEQGYYIPLKFVDNSAAKATLKLKPNTKYVITGTYIYTGNARFMFRINDGPYRNVNDSFETDATGVVNIKIGSSNVDVSDPSKMEKIMIVESTLKDIYEPFKSNILTCNEEVTLRGIGDIKDELNLTTGEYTKAVYEYTFTGNEYWEIGGGATGGYTYFQCKLEQLPINYKYTTDANIPIHCNRLPKITYNDFDNRLQNVGINLTYFFRLNFSDCNSNNGATVEDLKAYLKTNPTTVQYPISKSVKTVELSTLDQDGKETKLSTFDDITHVTVSSEGLVPTGDIDIARPIQFVDYSLDNGEATLYNTIDYPVKSAVLRGQTLKNITDYNIEANSNVTIEADGTITITATGTYTEVFLPALEKLPSTKYWVGINVIENTLNGDFVFHATTGVNCIFAYSANITQGFVGVNEQVRTTMADVSSAVYAFRSYLGSKVTEGSIKYKVIVIPYQEGMENLDIPYFTGIQSVKMPVLTTTGKNLITPFTKWSILSGNSTAYTLTDKRVEIVLSRWNMGVRTTIQLKPNTLYHVAWDEVSKANFNFTGTDKKGDVVPFKSFTTDDTGIVGVSIKNSTSSGTLIIDGLRIYEGDTDLGYEPYKSTTISCNEEVVLRSLSNGVKDTLNCMTGEYIQHIKEFVLDGSSDESIGITNVEDTTLIRFNIDNVAGVQAGNTNEVLCDLLPYLHIHDLSGGSAKVKQECISNHSQQENMINIIINRSRLSSVSVEGFRAYLQSNPITIQYSIKTPIVKTVDLSTVDQDENALLILENGEYIITENGDYIKVDIKSKKTKLKTFDDITHVTVSSEGLIPTGEITVATKNATDVIDASVMSLRMDDISNSQRTLEGSANAQSDDIDVTMLGTTDIYEQLL